MRIVCEVHYLFSEGGGRGDPVIFLPNKRVIISRLHLRAQAQGQLFKLENNILMYSQSGHKENVIPLSEEVGVVLLYLKLFPLCLN